MGNDFEKVNKKKIITKINKNKNSFFWFFCYKLIFVNFFKIPSYKFLKYFKEHFLKV